MKKRIISILLTVCLLTTLLPAEAMAEEWKAFSSEASADSDAMELSPSHNLIHERIAGNTEDLSAGISLYAEEETVTYTLENGAQIMVTASGVITGGTPGSDGRIDIPAEIPIVDDEGIEQQRINVTRIGNESFRDCSGLKEVTIPDSVTYIEVDAFYNCTELTSVNIPDGVTTLMGYIFWGCTALTTVTLPSNLAFVPEGMFINCSSLTSINIPSSVTDIQSSVFLGCKALESVSIPESVTRIGADAFSGCSSLKSISLPNSVTDVGDGAFSNCINLSTIDLPAGLTSINSELFYKCHSLESIVIPENVTTIGDSAFSDCQALSDIILPNSVTTIKVNAFSGCKSLTTVTIPGNVTSIGTFAFSYCDNLSEVVILDGVTAIEQGTFRSCIRLQNVSIPDTVTSIGIGAFYECELLESITIPYGVTSIEKQAFSQCKSLQSITIPDSVTSIGESAFAYCLGMTSITISKNITSIPAEMCSGCKNLASVEIPYGVTIIGTRAFGECEKLTDVTIPNSVVTIDNGAFWKCESLASVVVPDSVTTIEGFAFAYNDNLVSVIIPESVTSITYYVFHGCPGLQSAGPIGGDYNIQFGWKDYLPDNAFSCASHLTDVTIPESVTKIGKAAFEQCFKLTEITIPSGVTAIEEGVFDSCKALSEIIIPSGVDSIGERAFSNCEGLTSISIPEGVTSIGRGAFGYCKGLTSISIPSSVTVIGMHAFSDCIGLTNVVIPDGVTSLEGAFSDCSNLSAVTIPESVTYIPSYEFEGASPDFVLYCYPDSYAETYAKTFNVNYQLITTSGRILSVSLLGEDGEAISEGFTVTWFDADGNEIAASLRLQGANVEKNYSFEVQLDDALSAIYEQPERQTITPSDPAARQIQLVKKVPIKTLVLLGQVKGQTGAVLPDTSVTVTPESGNLEELTTGPDGKFTTNIPYGKVSIVIRKEGFYSKRETLDLTNETGDTIDMGVYELTPIQVITNQITLNVNQRRASESSGDAIEIPLTSLGTTRISLTGNSGPITNFDVQGLTLLFQPGTVSANETITVAIQDSSGIYQPASAAVTLDGNCLGSAELTMVQKGSFVLGGISGPEANLLVFDGSGNCIQTSAAISGLSSKAMEPGTYQLVFLKKSDLLRGISNLGYLGTFGLSEGQDYLRRQITIQDGAIIRLADCTVPNLDESRISYTVKDNTSVTTSSPSGVVVGGLLAVRAAYELDTAKGATAGNVKILLPAGIDLLNTSVSIDNQSVPYTYDVGTHEVTISVSGRDNAVVWLYCTPAKSGSYSISAVLTLTSGASQPMGTAVIQAEDAVLEIPERTGEASGLTASGKANPGSNVTLYDEDQPVGTATANAAGNWSMTFNLPEPTYSYSYHNFHAVMSGGTLPEPLTTESALLTYDARLDAALTKITMYNTGDKGEQSTVFDFTKATGITPYYRMWPSRYPTFTFKAEFSGHGSLLSEVYVVTANSAGDETYVKMTYDSASGAWVGAHDYTSFHDAPVKVTAAYAYGYTGEIPIDEDMREATTEAYLDASKEVMAELDAKLHDAYNCTEPVINGNTLSTRMTYTDPDTGVTEEFGSYCLEAAPLDAGVTESTLVDEGFFFMDEAQLWSRTEYGDATITRVYVDLNDRTYLTERTAFDAQKTYSDISDDTMTLVTNSFLWGIFDDWGPGELHYQIVKTLQFIPGYFGLAASLTEGFAKTYESQAIWRTRLNGDVYTLKTDLDTVLYGVLEARCKNTGVRRVPDNVYTSARMALLLMPAEINEYEKKAREIINQSLGVNLLWFALSTYMEKCSVDLSSKIDSGTLGITSEVLARISTTVLDSISYSSTILEILSDVQQELTSVKSNVDDFIDGRHNEIRKRLDDLSKSIKASYISCDTPEEEISSALLESTMQQPVSRRVSYIMDPSGYVYEAVPSNRLDGVTAEISSEANGTWNAADYDQMNPQITGADGSFYWDVPQGNWKVSLSKDGYTPTDTSKVEAAVGGWLPVPPPQLDIYVGMVSNSAPTVKQVAAYTNQVVLEFSQYMDIDSLQNVITLIGGGDTITDISIVPLDKEFNLEGTQEYATRFAILCGTGDLPDEVVVTVGTGAKNYAGAAIQAEYISPTLTTSVQPTSIDAPDEVSTDLHGTVTVEVTLQPDVAGKELVIENLSPDLLSVGTRATTGPDGTVKISVTGNLPGSGLIKITEPVSGLSKTIIINVSVDGATIIAPEKPTATLENGKAVTSGITVPSGTKITLHTSTVGATIRYTLDDTCPCEEAALHYSGPITITQNTILRAAAYKDGVYSDTIRLEIKVSTSGSSSEPTLPPTPPDTPVAYTISFDANGGKVAPLSLTTNASGKLTSLPIPTREGFVFEGWFTAPTSGRRVTESEQYTGNTTLYAHWTEGETPPSANSYKVYFDGNGGISGTDMLTTDENGKLGELPTAAREGFVFEGWFTAPTGGRRVTESEQYTSNTTLYAHWTQGATPPSSITYKVTFNGNGGICSITVLTTDENGKLNHLPTATREGYTFDGWYDAPTGGRRVTEDEQYTSDTTLYAHWTQGATPPSSITFKVAFNGNGGTCSVTMLTTDENGKLSYLPTAVRSGYTFDGWFFTPTGGRRVTENEQYTGDTILYAQWTRKSSSGPSNTSGGGGSSSSSRRYTVSISDVTGGEISASTKQAYAGTQVTLTVKPDAGYDLSSLEVIRNNKTQVVVTKKSDTLYSFAMPSSDVEVQASFKKSQTADDSSKQIFSDVSPNYWAADEIGWGYENNLIRGVGDGLFNPEGNITRQQLWMILARYADENPANMVVAQKWAVDNSITDGTRPGEAVTRQQLVTILYRYAQMNGRDVAGGADLTAYVDSDSVSNYAKTSLTWAVSDGIINGTSDGRLNPTGYATRAQFAVIMYRFHHSTR